MTSEKDEKTPCEVVERITNGKKVEVNESVNKKLSAMSKPPKDDTETTSSVSSMSNNQIFLLLGVVGVIIAGASSYYQRKSSMKKEQKKEEKPLIEISEKPEGRGGNFMPF